MHIETSNLPHDLRTEISNFIQGISEHTFVSYSVDGVEINTNHSTLGKIIHETVIGEIGRRYSYIIEDDGDKIKITGKLHWFKAFVRRAFRS